MPWKNPFAEESKYQKTAYYLLLALLTGLAFSARIVILLPTILLGVITLVHPERSALWKGAFRDPFFLSCFALFIVKAAGIFYSGDAYQTFMGALGRFDLVTIPLFFCSNNRGIAPLSMRRLMLFFSLSLAVVSLYCLGYAAVQYASHHDSSVFFYHTLLKPLRHHAILFSFYIFFCIVYWMEEGLAALAQKIHKRLLIVLLVYFFGFILLLSSKLVIGITIAYLLFFIFRNLFAHGNRTKILVTGLSLLAVISLVVLTDNPVKNRYADMMSGNAVLFRQEKFTPGTYFNGLQFRLLTWRFTYEILTERKDWLLGVSLAEAQKELNRKYIETNVYRGNDSTDLGYLAFNCHNVFLQTTLESGLTGLLFLILAIVSFLVQTIKRRRVPTLIFFLGILAFGFTESLLTSQYTVLLFLLFPLLSLHVRRET